MITVGVNPVWNPTCGPVFQVPGQIFAVNLRHTPGCDRSQGYFKEKMTYQLSCMHDTAEDPEFVYGL